MAQAIAFDVGQLVLSDSTAMPIYPGGKPKAGIQVKSLLENSGVIYLGSHLVSPTKSYPLDPGESVFFPIDNTDQFFALASVDGDILHFLFV